MNGPVFIRTSAGLWLNVDAIAYVGDWMSDKVGCTITLRDGVEVEHADETAERLMRRLSTAITSDSWNAEEHPE